MSFDNSRYTFNPWNDFLGVVMQQGRVQLDSDWNEWLAELSRRIQAGTMDTMGRAVVPSTTPNAFKINAVSDSTGQHITIGAGRMYVDGLMVENHGAVASAQWDSALAEMSGAPAAPPPVAEVDLDFTAQPYLPGAALPTTGGPFLVYLDVWHRAVSYLEYPDLIEKAVGVDTTGRLQMVWQVKLLDLSGSSGVTCDSSIPAWDALIAPSGSQLTTAVVQSTSSGPCCLTPSSGYTGMENQLYRVEIHQGGAANSSGASSPVAATFKWSRDDASVITAVTAINPATNVAHNPTSQLTVLSAGRDNVLSFQPGDWIEINDDFLELNGQSGELHQIDSNGVSKALNTITLETPVSSAFQTRLTSGIDYHTRICRWDQGGKVYQSDGVTVWVDLDAVGSTGQIPVPPPGTSLILENGVTVTFSLNASIPSANFRVGDFWAFAARTSDGSVQILTQAPPLGIHHHYARLSIVTFPTSASDCRSIWPPTITAGGDCACTVCVDAADHNSGVATIAMAVEQIQGSGGGRICLGPGIFVLSSTLLLENLESVVLSGQGFATALVFSGSGPAIAAQSDLGLRIEDLSVFALAAATLNNTGFSSASTSSVAVGILLRNCIEIAIERCAVYAISASASVGTFAPAGTALGSMAVALDGFLIETLIRDNVLSADVGIGEASLIASFREARSLLVLVDLEVVSNLLPCNLAGAALLELGAASENPEQLNMFLLETTFRGNRVIGCSVVGIGIEGVSLPDAVLRIADNHVDVSGNGIACGADGAEIADNLVTQAMTAASSSASSASLTANVMGISIISVPGGKLPITEARILRNRINNYGGVGISVSGLVLISSITGNSIMNVTTTGIAVTGPQALSEVMVRDNEIFSVVAPAPAAAPAGAEFGPKTGAANLGNELPLSSASAEANPVRVTGILLSNTTTATVENNSVASVGTTPSTGGIATAVGIEVSGSTTTLISDNDVTDIGTDPTIAESVGVAVSNCATTTVSDNAIQQATPALTQATAFLAILIDVSSGQMGQVVVTGNQIAGNSKLGILVGILAADCVFSANFCRQLATAALGTKTQLSQAVVDAAVASTFIASGNRIICGREQHAMDIEPTATGGTVNATVLGNITGGPIILSGTALAQPWAPLNVIA